MFPKPNNWVFAEEVTVVLPVATDLNALEYPFASEYGFPDTLWNIAFPGSANPLEFK